MERVILNVFTVSASISAVRMLILVTSDGNSKIFQADGTGFEIGRMVRKKSWPVILPGRRNRRLENNRKKENTGGIILMNKTELVAAMAEQTNLSKKDVEAALKAFIDVVAEELKKGEKVQLVGFGTFEVSERAAREGRNPQTGETMQIKASKTPKFKAGKALKDMMN